MDMEMFLDEYPLWEVGGLHHPIILQGMFVYAAKSGQKEAERLIHWSHWHGLPRLDPEADVLPVQLVGHQTSKEEIQDLFHKVYMLKRLPGLPPCGLKWMEKATRDILSSLRNHLWRRGGTVKLEEDQRGAATAYPWPSHQTEPHSQIWGRDHLHDKALQEAREVHWQLLEVAHMLELNIERLNKEADGVKCQCPYSHSCPWGRSLERHIQSPNWHSWRDT